MEADKLYKTIKKLVNMYKPLQEGERSQRHQPHYVGIDFPITTDLTTSGN